MKKKLNYKYSIGEIIKDNKRDIVVIDRHIKTTINSSTNNEIHKKIYTIKCNKCNTISQRNEVELKAYKKGCPCEGNHFVVTGYNDFATLCPNLVKYFKNPEEAKNIRKHCTKMFDMVCPYCGKEKKMKPSIIATTNKFSCDFCSDGISYPNKFMYSILEQLGVEYVPEYSPKWIGNKRYDVYFSLNSQKYIIEMHGGWHYIYNNLTGETASEQNMKDSYKRKEAIKHGYKVIEIDSRISDMAFIRKSVENSLIGKLFDLSTIDWVKCHKNATNSIVYDICKYYNQNPRITIEELAEVFGVSKNTISLYLQRGAAIGICSYENKYKKAKEKYEYTIQLYNNNPSITLKELSALVGVNRNQVALYLKKGTENGKCCYLDRKQKIDLCKKNLDNAIKNNPGISISELIKLTNYPSTTVRRFCKEVGYG